MSDAEASSKKKVTASALRFALEISAMGQSIAARLEVMDACVRVHIALPPMLAFFSGMISAAVRDQGTKLLS